MEVASGVAQSVVVEFVVVDIDRELVAQAIVQEVEFEVVGWGVDLWSLLMQLGPNIGILQSLQQSSLHCLLINCLSYKGA